MLPGENLEDIPVLGARDDRDADAPTLEWELVALASLRDLRKARCWRLSPPPPCTSSDFLAARKATLDDETLATLALRTPPPFSSPLGAPNSGSLKIVVRPGVPPSLTANAGGFGVKVRKTKTRR